MADPQLVALRERAAIRTEQLRREIASSDTLARLYSQIGR